MNVFYVPEPTLRNTLSEEESQHAVKVLRLKEGEEIILIDGKGGYYKAKITFPDAKHCEFEIIETIPDFGKLNYYLHIAIAPTKNMERFEWFVEKAIEIGISEITPIICQFSERKVIKMERLEKIMIAAAKQSIRAYFPKLNPSSRFDDFLKKYQDSQQFIAHCYSFIENSEQIQKLEKKKLKDVAQKSLGTIILIGPEGDFSKEEIKKAIAAGYIPISLGENRLRTETAGIIACHTIALINQ
ncbi:MAG: 16S rRNA (uracil(1498)-N(3))-methyltransferase [Paludibacteraceae bacterium]|nr:16S rRNA (uracil(1498)-N(3))-methyltransferase [Paludibacteraceae bacterium]